MVTRTVIRITSPEAAALTATATEESSSAAAAPTSTKKSTVGNTNKNGGGKKRDLPSGGAMVSDRDVKKRQRADRFVFDLSDVPPQPPIPKIKGHVKEGSSKYTGVTFNKATNKWQARIMIEGKERSIGYYENEEEAATDYARAVYKYKGQEALNNLRERNSSAPSIDLSDVPPQQPIPKSEGRIKEGSSKYTGIYFNKSINKWQAQIYIGGNLHHIGYYENEEEAATDYARAVFKYKGENALVKARERKSSGSVPAMKIDLSDVPPQQPVPKIKGHIKEGASKYTGVSFSKTINKWTATIMIEGKNRRIGDYVNEEEAAIDYARAVFKYKGQEVLDKAREPNKCTPAIDLSAVPPQLPILKRVSLIKEGSSKYTGVTFLKARNKWQAQIKIEGKQHHIGSYKNEEEAAVDYARALFKYKGQKAQVKEREQKSSGTSNYLSDVRPQQTPHQPIPRSPKHLLLLELR